MYSKEELLRKTEEQVKKERFTHILGVIETAVQLAKREGVDPEKAEISAILHDYCKAWNIERMKAILLAHNDTNWLSYPAVLWHAPVAFYVAQSELSINDPDILHAIYYHTTGRVAMTTLEKVIWVADYIEPNRNFPGVERARELSNISLDEALRFGLAQTIQLLSNREQAIYPLTFEAYNYYHNLRR